MNDNSDAPKFPRWPGEPGRQPDDVKQRINELLFYALPPTTTIGDMETIAGDLALTIHLRWDASLNPSGEG